MDGIWLDMNEVTTLCHGECPDGDNAITVGKESEYPYDPIGPDYNLTGYSLSLDAQHWYPEGDEIAKEFNTEYNMHSLYATMQVRATYEFWIKGSPLQHKRQMILSRSSFAGFGKWGAHWLGDGWSLWAFMQFSISGIMNMNMFGIPLVGADVCGFHKPWEQEMCGRWMQLSVFYPFARNHYNLTDEDKGFLPPQEPYLLEEPYLTAARHAIDQRYRYLRYYYTLLFEIARFGGGTMVRPMFFEFPEDEGAYQGYEQTFMIGKCLKATPVLVPDDENNGQVNSYFPKGVRFLSLNDFSTITPGQGKNMTLEASWIYTNAHLREGFIMPYQNTTRQPADRTTTLIKEVGITLVVFADTHGEAEGTLYIDENGDDVYDFINKKYQYYKFSFGSNTLKIDLQDGEGANGPQDKGNQVLEEVLFLDMEHMAEADVIACVYDNNLLPKEVKATFDSEINAIRITALDDKPLLFTEIQSIQIADKNNNTSFCSVKYSIKNIAKLSTTGDSNIQNQMVVDIGASGSTVLPDLRATFTLIDDEILRVQINDPNDNAYEAPMETFDPDFDLEGKATTIDIEAILKLSPKDDDFYYEVHDFNDPTKIYYTTQNKSFVYSEYYKKTTANIDSTGNIFGLGERVGEFFLDQGVYTLWNRDEPSPVEDGERPGKNIYGTHPIYFTQMTSKTKFFGVFDHNAGAQDYIIKKAKKGYDITHIKTSGVTDQFIITNAPIQRVISNYYKIVGKPVMVPEWALGWHQCRYGYNNTQQVREVVQGYLENNIPLDVMWTDIDYMEMYQDFTVSDSAFKDLPEAVEQWKLNHMIRYVPILDAAVAYVDGKDTPYSRGKSKDLFVKDANNPSKPFIGKVWPGPAVYIDWLHEKAEEYWIDEMEKLHEKLKFDGMWIDMNEASNFCDGYCFKDQRVVDSIQNKLFYIPGSRDLNAKSISIDAKHVDDRTEFDVHSLYGFYMSKATSAYFSDKLNERPFVISRSTYAGAGKYVSHWLGDNFSKYELLQASVSGIFNFQMFGISVAGADICGFIDDTNKDLCARWYALGAFYPFARNHNDKDAIPQEPYVSMFKDNDIGKTPGYTYMDFIRETALKRYAIHRYQYSYTHKGSTDGTLYFKPLFYDYPADDLAYKRVENNVLLGDSIKLSPIVDEYKSYNFYFPDKDATWCPIWPKSTKKCFSGGRIQEGIIELDEVFVHIKSGSIIPLQLDDFNSVPENINIEKLKDEPLDLGILTDTYHEALGWVRYDDGLTQDLTKYSEFLFKAVGAKSVWSTNYIDLTIIVNKDDSDIKDTKDQHLGTIIIYNASRYSFSNSSKATVILKNGSKAEFEASCPNDKTNICRYRGKDGADINLRDIEKVHISAK